MFNKYREVFFLVGKHFLVGHHTACFIQLFLCNYYFFEIIT